MRQFQRSGPPSTRQRRRLAWAPLALFLVVAAIPASGADKALPVPRFVALRSDKVNVRAGPGDQYPIDWVYQRKDLPVEIVAEFQNWRKIRDAEGTVGWVHERMVTGRRSVVVRGQVRTLHDEPKAESSTVARVEPGVIAKLLQCDPDWCRIEASGVAGWLRRDEIWGVYPSETIQ